MLHVVHNAASQSDWDETKGKLKHQFELLTHNDVHIAESIKEEMFTKLQVSLGKSREELMPVIADL